MSSYDVTITDRGDGTVCFTATITPASWTARDARELATDLARCLNPGHVITAVRSGDEGRAES